jgi:hypothetical protein
VHSLHYATLFTALCIPCVHSASNFFYLQESSEYETDSESQQEGAQAGPSCAHTVPHMPLLLCSHSTLHLRACTSLLQESSEYETDSESEEEGAPGRPKLVRPVFVRKQEREVGRGLPQQQQQQQ